MLLLFVLTLLVHAVLTWQYRRDPFATLLVADAQSYDEWAARWALNGSGAEPVFHQSPLFPWWLSWVYRLVGQTWRVVAVSAIQGLLSAVAISLWVPIGRIWFGRASVGLVAGLLAFAFAPFHFYALKLLPVSTALATQAIGMLCLGRAAPSTTRGSAFVAGAAWGVACLARAEMLLAALPFALWLARRTGVPLDVRRALSFMLGLGCLIAPATMHNLRQGDRVVIASSTGENFFIGNQRDATGGHHSLSPMAGDLFSQRTAALELAQDSLDRPLRPSEVSSFWTSRAMDEIRADPLGWCRLMAQKSWRMLHPGDPTDLYSLPLERRLYLPLLFLLPASSWAIFIMGGIGLRLAQREVGTHAWPLIFWLLTNMCVLLVFFANARLRLPLLFGLCGHAALAVVWFLAGQGRRRRIGAAILVATVIVGLAATRYTSRDVLRLASVLSAQQRLDESLDALRVELSRPNPNALVLDQAGWVLQKQGDFDRSRQRYLEALNAGLPPGREPQTRTRLAQVMERLGFLDGALEQHDRAVSNEFADAGSYHERGMFHGRRGRRELAIADFQQALRRDPTFAAPASALRSLGVEIRPRRGDQRESP